MDREKNPNFEEERNPRRDKKAVEEEEEGNGMQKTHEGFRNGSQIQQQWTRVR